MTYVDYVHLGIQTIFFVLNDASIQVMADMIRIPGPRILMTGTNVPKTHETRKKNSKKNMTDYQIYH